jgi:integrase
LAESGISICNRNRIMTGVKFLFRVTLRRLELAAEIYHLREPQKIPQVMSPDETRRVLAVATSLKARVALSLCYGCGLRAGEVVRLKVKHIDSAQNIIRIEQSKGRKDRNVMLSPETLDLLLASGGRFVAVSMHIQRPFKNVGCFLVASRASR